ncbi:MAG: phosphoribosylformylglycinamidine synthase, partial [Clostridia bacterium]|nr:phosphoribosylformylglycinamidine synthase [Clostridia bacterium]
MVYRIYVEKKNEFAHEAASLLSDIKDFLGIDGIESVRVINRYDVENIEETLFENCINTVFSEPQLDNTSKTLDLKNADVVFAVEFLPGQFDQRADSASQCIQIISQGDRPLVRTAKVYMLKGKLKDSDVAEIKKYVINPVESREASLDEVETLASVYEVPTSVETLDGFTKLSESELDSFVKNYGLAMDLDDIKFCQQYFIKEQRDPTITEIRMIDTYWSDHCRHTTFLTTIDSVKFEDEILQKAYDRYIATRKEIGRTTPQNLMDIGTIAAKYLKATGKLTKLDESEEINACTVKIKVNVEG